MSNLPTNYVDDVLNADVNTQRKYQMIQNGDGTVSFVDVTDYSTTGSTIGASQINAQNTAINKDTKNVSWYGTCSTAAATTAKVATTTDTAFALATGAKVKIKFTNANTASAPTLNVDSKGAKAIKAYGTTAPTSWWKAGDIVEFTYDGTNWIMAASQGEIEQINQHLTDLREEIPKMANPVLDFAHPLHIFRTAIPSGEPASQSYSLTFTATKECYLLGSIAMSSYGSRASATIKINDVTAFSVEAETSGADRNSNTIPLTKLKAGDVVTSNQEQWLHVYDVIS